MSLRFTFTLDSGEIVTGPVQGSGGTVKTSARLDRACRQARLGRDSGLYEPQTGHVMVYPEFSYKSDGPAIVVSLLNSTWMVA